jgi:hypothetical protein
MSNVEKQRAFRKRMAEKGYTQQQVWVLKKDLDEKKITPEEFRKRLAELTSGFGQVSPPEKRGKLFAETLALVKAKKEEYEK